jgi:urease accessory protein
MDVSAGIGGLLHPLVTPVHVIALAGLGVMARRDTASAGAAIIGAFALGLVFGLGAVAWGVAETPAGDVLLAVATLCGLTAAVGVAVPAPLAAAMALASGVALGLDSPPDAIRLGDAVAALAGTACGGIVGLAAIALLASTLGRPGYGIVLRVAGSWIAAIAILVLALRWAV